MKRRKRKNPRKKALIISITAILIWILGFYIYTTYNKIEINNQNYETCLTRKTSDNGNKSIQSKEFSA